MLNTALTDPWNRGMRRFDVAVPSRNRGGKTLFETHGFKIRSIIVHHENV